MFNKIVSELAEEFDLDNSADKILLQRMAMYMIRVVRAEVYEVEVGVGDNSVRWGEHIARMDNMVRGYFNDLAISRAKRQQLEKGEALLVSLDEVMRKFAKVEKKNSRSAQNKVQFRTLNDQPHDLPLREQLWLLWVSDYPKLKSLVDRRKEVGREKTEK